MNHTNISKTKRGIIYVLLCFEILLETISLSIVLTYVEEASCKIQNETSYQQMVL